MASQRKKRKVGWIQAEDDLLLEVVCNYQREHDARVDELDWGEIAIVMSDRTRDDCVRRLERIHAAGNIILPPSMRFGKFILVTRPLLNHQKSILMIGMTAKKRFVVRVPRVLLVAVSRVTLEILENMSTC
jgi:hypothetical protein